MFIDAKTDPWTHWPMRTKPKLDQSVRLFWGDQGIPVMFPKTEKLPPASFILWPLSK